MLVGQFDGACCTRRNRKDADLEEAASQPLEQCRIAPAAHDFLIDRACLILVVELALDGFAVDRHLEAARRGIRRQREDIGPLDLTTGIVAEDLHDAHRGDRAINHSVHLMEFDRNRKGNRWHWCGRPRDRRLNREIRAVGRPRVHGHLCGCRQCAEQERAKQQHSCKQFSAETAGIGLHDYLLHQQRRSHFV